MMEMFGKYKYEYHKLNVDLSTPYLKTALRTTENILLVVSDIFCPA
jgi:hypothetical protein